MRSDVTYQEALFQQNLVWNVSWAGVSEDICGIEALPFTPLHFVRLAAARSPFVCGGREPTETDVGNFLWSVSPLYDPCSRWKKFRHWLRYFQACRKVTRDQFIASIDEYLEEAWQDSPPRPANGGKSKAYYSPVVSLMRALCPEYSMTPETVLRTPYKQLFQLYKPVGAAVGVPLTAPADSAFLRERSRTRN